MRKCLYLFAFAICLFSDPVLAAPIRLDDLIERALAGHPTALAATASVEAQLAAIGLAESQRLPQLSISSGLTQTTQVSNTVTATESVSIGNAQVAMRQQIFDFGRTDAAIAEARAGADASRQAARQDAVEIAYAVRRGYLGWLRDRSLAALSERRAESARRVRDQAAAFYKAGKRSRIDLTRAEAAAQMAGAEAGRSRAAAEAAALALEAAVADSGVAAGEPVLPPEPAIATLPLADLLALARDRHPGLGAAAARLRRAEAARSGADQSVWPELRADGSYGLRYRALSPNQNWSVGLTLSAPLFDGFATERAKDEAAAGERGAREGLRGLGLEVDLAVRKAVLAARSARDRLPASEAAVSSARDNLELAEGRYAAGVGSVIEVGDAQVLLASAESERSRDRIDYHLALADLLRATGLTGLEN